MSYSTWSCRLYCSYLYDDDDDDDDELMAAQHGCLHFFVLGCDGAATLLNIERFDIHYRYADTYE